MKILIGIVLAAVITFLWQNWSVLNESITIRLIGSVEYPLWSWFAAVFVTGCLTWYIFSFKARRQLKTTVTQQEREILKMKSELDKFRNLPLTDDEKSPEPVSGTEDSSGQKE
ncbi:LapA family protein [Fibrobacterota bacterium]